MEINVVDSNKSPINKLEISEEVFLAQYNESLIHQVVVAIMAGARAGTKAQKTRGEVSGGGAKPWRQKGTGRARAGSSRSPIWRKGGVAFAATPRDHSQKVNKKMYRGALRSILSELVRAERLIVVDNLSVSQIKTKEALKTFGALNFKQGLIILEELDVDLFLAARNIPNIEIITVEEINPVNLIHAKEVLITAGALKLIERKVA